MDGSTSIRPRRSGLKRSAPSSSAAPTRSRIVRQVLVRYHAFMPPPGAPDFFRFGKAGAIERALRAAGFDARYMSGGHYAWKAMKGPVKLFE